jgi:hypothetical protein
MKQIFYKKQGSRYVPVSEYDNELLDSFPKGDHLVSVYPGGGSRRYRIDPALAPMIAAGRYAEDAMSNALIKASEMRPKSAPMTEEQQSAWNRLIAVFGEEARYLEWPSARDVAEAGVKAMQEEADRLMKNDGIRKAYEHFMLMCKLTKERENADT